MYTCCKSKKILHKLSSTRSGTWYQRFLNKYPCRWHHRSKQDEENSNSFSARSQNNENPLLTSSCVWPPILPHGTPVPQDGFSWNFTYEPFFIFTKGCTIFEWILNFIYRFSAGKKHKYKISWLYRAYLYYQSLLYFHQQMHYTGCPRRNVWDFVRVFLMLNYNDITQNTYIQSWNLFITNWCT